MKKYLFCVFIILLCLSCGKKETASTVERTQLRIGTDATYPPFEFINIETGKPQGFDIDLITEICKVNGWQPEIIVTPFSGIIPGLQNNVYDVVLSAMTITNERAEVINFSEPYYLAGQIVAVPLENENIKSIVDLKGKKVGVQQGTTGQMMAKKIDSVQVFSFDNIGVAFLDMNNGNLDAVLNDFPTTQAYIKKHHSAKTVGEILSSEYYGIGMRKADTTLLKAINQALVQIKSDGRYTALHVKWFNSEPASQFLQQDTTGAVE